jgi:hypothetical protein
VSFNGAGQPKLGEKDITVLQAWFCCMPSMKLSENLRRLVNISAESVDPNEKAMVDGAYHPDLAG